MKPYCTFLLLLLCHAGIAQQEVRVHNTTDKVIEVFETWYSADTTKSVLVNRIDPKIKTQTGGGYYQPLRLDVFAVDTLNRDTLFSATYTGSKLIRRVVEINVEEGKKSKEPTLHPVDRIKLEGKNLNVQFQVGRKLKLKNSEHKRVKGIFTGFRGNSIVLTSKKGKRATIAIGDITRCRTCKWWEIGPWFRMFPRCSYKKVDPSKSGRIRQVLTEYEQGKYKWEWEVVK